MNPTLCTPSGKGEPSTATPLYQVLLLCRYDSAIAVCLRVPVIKLNAVDATTTITSKYEQCLVTNLVTLSHALYVCKNRIGPR